MIRHLLRASYHHFVKPRFVRYRLATAGAALHLDFYGEGIGFFAQLAAILQFFRHAEAPGFQPVVSLTSLNYLDSDMGDDWFEYYFERRLPAVTASASQGLRIGNIKELPEFERDLSLAEANALFDKYVRIKPDITGAVDQFCRAHAIGPGIVGVHYRGTDKVGEAALVAYDAVFSAIGAVLAGRPGARGLFVTSDEQAFIGRIAARFPELDIVTLNDSRRSDDGQPVHLGQRAPGNYALGRDALMNSLVLSRCGAVVRSTSFLSAWASIFNPALPVVLLNTPYDHKLWFPEREIMKGAVLARNLTT